MAIAATVVQHLDQAGIAYDVVPHPQSYSSREAAVAAHVDPAHIAKAVVLRDQAGTFLMAVIPGDQWVKLHSVEQEVNRKLALAAEADAERLFPDCAPGAIPPLGAGYGLETLVDEALFGLADVYFEAGDHQELIHVSAEDFRILLGGARHGYYSHPD